MAEYSRKQNTNNYHIRIERQLTKGEALLRNVRAKISNHDDLVQRNEEVEEWLSASREELRHIYTAEELVEGLKVTTDLDLNELSHQAIIETMDAIVTDRMASLNEIREQTHIFDGK